MAGGREEFHFGYRFEGEANKSGRGPSVWDTFTYETPGALCALFFTTVKTSYDYTYCCAILERILDHSNGDIAVDFYYRFREDIKNVKDMGFDALRFSISWSRVIPILKPFVMIFHWDTLQAQEDKYGGFLSPNIVNDYRDYANLLFETFGEQVQNWMAFNEPWALSEVAYDDGLIAPGQCSPCVNPQCPVENSAIEPYIVAHYILLAHATAFQVYREKYKERQSGQIRIALVSLWFKPLSNRIIYIKASKIAIDFMWMDPLTYGRASVSLMPLSLYEKLNMGDLKSTHISLHLADRSIKYPERILENVPLKVEKFYIPVDFVILDMEENSHMPIILKRPFLATACALINVKGEKLTLRVEEDQLVFNIGNGKKKQHEDVDSYLRIDIFDELVDEHFRKSYLKAPLENCLVHEESTNDEKPKVAAFA
ncbi:beta-glucosidase 12-like [Hevea brasiliensis]|uniref:beta-glucosidase 12-like n=1 Tax=Hevea brasiliensis TaxID=3981 RepID=UPI0025F8D6C1|nr:beta-glucosidase 12-like [Hevea brasiliensis]